MSASGALSPPGAQSAQGAAPTAHPRRLSALFAPWLLAVPVAVAHLALALLWPEDHFGWGDGAGPTSRIDVAFVRELAPAQPAPLAGPPPGASPDADRAPRAVPVPRPAASAAAEGAGAAPPAAASAAASALASASADEAPAPRAELPEPAADVAAAQALPAAAALDPIVAPAFLTPASVAASALAVAATGPAPAIAGPPASAPTSVSAAAPPTVPASVTPPSSAQTFEWPPSTRLSYLLTGNYRGPVEGQARVEWRLSGGRYQVALDVSIGPPFAPLLSRQIQSDGIVTSAGLEPRRYDEETRIVLRSPRRLSIVFEGDHVLLPSGRQLPRPSGVQDSASQFVQLTWLFTMQPERLRVGTLLPLPLALPRHVEVWTYEVLGHERLETPVGVVEAVHVRPRRPPRPPRPQGSSGGTGGGDLVAEFWVAPTLQYLPVRILIRQDEETYVDLLLQRLPQQAEPVQR